MLFPLAFILVLVSRPFLSLRFIFFDYVRCSVLCTRLRGWESKEGGKQGSIHWEEWKGRKYKIEMIAMEKMRKSKRESVWSECSTITTYRCSDR
ncbi:hypothetical protein I7I50_06360 [Histoplasma capsulatum G186AR]|uniref:Uncharacterized protein n=1 Tax=Ajellomyces capsulatus TaxID=5037 RepID=A0A8H8D408_AJECA|nr:hypothetical protein I7I52_10567 [Histoplasma capsulatum]QSS67324.1 hypothetical protein I7I50_06360 [Histoplasma capsulatum G186AR]